MKHLTLDKNGILVSTGSSIIKITLQSFDRLLHAGDISWVGGTWFLKQ
jgi:hypothetical protein